MRKRKTEKRIIFILTAMLTAVCLMLTSCGNPEQTGVRIISSVPSRNTITAPGENPVSLHYSENRDSYIPAAASGFIELRVDEKTKSFGIFEQSSKTLWTALPLLEDAGNAVSESCSASMVSLKVLGGTDIYSLNSQDNSLAYDKATVRAGEGFVEFTYNIFANAETASRNSYKKDDIGFRVVLTVVLTDGNMNVSCTYENITGNKNAVIEEIELLNYFGAYNDMGDENFLFVPDGCGAIIKTANYDESFEPLSFAVYGNDVSNPKETSGDAVLPVFGIRRGNSAVAALIEKGDAVSTIKAEKAMSMTDYNRTYASFNITPSAYENGTLSISKASTVNEIKMCYRFLSGINATYAGMASAMREQFIRNSVISAKTIEATDYLPMFITLTGITGEKIGKLKYSKTLTDFEQTQDMLTRIKNKGINNVDIRYKGVLNGGENQEDISKTHVLARLGGSTGLSELNKYMSSRDMKLYLDINILSSSEEISSGNAVNIFKDETTYGPGSYLSGLDYGQRTLRTWGSMKKVIASTLADFKGYDFTGFCLGDAGSILYSDFSGSGMLRQEASETIAGKIPPLSSSREIMVEKGNFYMLKNINSVIDVPLRTTVSKSGAYIPVPFVQIVLHGIVDYAGDPINLGINATETMLMYIEYGACPHYQWNYTPIEGTGETDIYYYENTVNQAAEFYARANGILNDLRDARITDHSEISDGVFCTEYDTGSLVYVNYTDADYEVLGLTVKARDFLRVN